MPARQTALLAALVLACPAIGLGQAWVPPKGKLDSAINFSFLDGGAHLTEIARDAGGNVIESHGSDPDAGDVFSRVTLFTADYGLTDRLALSGDLAFVAAKYEGERPHPGTIDDGSWNKGFQDAHFQLRFQAMLAPVILTPSIGFTIPTHDYDVLGHAAIGRGLNEMRLGVSAGWLAEPISRNLYIEGTYSYTIVEKIAVDEDADHHEHGEEPGQLPATTDISTNRSDLGLQFAFWVSPSISLGFYTHYTHTHGGLKWGAGFDEEVVHVHDQAAAERSVRMAISGSYSITPRLTVYAAFLTTTWGINTHDANTFTIGTGWTFNNPFKRPL